MPLIETLCDLFIRSAQRRGRNALFVDDADGIAGSDVPIRPQESRHVRRPTGPAGKLLRRALRFGQKAE